jgi:hypothetical protein
MQRKKRKEKDAIESFYLFKGFFALFSMASWRMLYYKMIQFVGFGQHF